jgi:hypothetical protein
MDGTLKEAKMADMTELKPDGVALATEVMRVRKDGVRVVRNSDGSVRLSVSEGRDSFLTDMWIGVDLSAEAAAHVAQLLMDAPRHG